MIGEPRAKSPIEIFFSYAHKDERIFDQLKTHLASLRNEGVISSWDDRQIIAGQEWDRKIKERIYSADVILLLVSADFIASPYCKDVEIIRAMERHESGEARVIPVILRPCEWQKTPFGKLQALPRNAKPVTKWDLRDGAFVSIAMGLRKAAENLFDDLNESPQQQYNQSQSDLPQLRLPVADFIGREEEIEQLASALTQAINTDIGQTVCVRGMGGVGKSGWLLRWCRE